MKRKKGIQNFLFDYVIIGGGSAGCVLANRLTQCGRYNVALIEAGGMDNSPWIRYPVGYFKTMGNKEFDWCYYTERDSGISNRSIPWPRGKVLGGSSAINGLLFVRGQQADYDAWRNLGNLGWAWQDVLPYFLKLENWEDSEASCNTTYRGFNGPMSVSSIRLRRKIVDAWLESAVNAGYPRNLDYNGDTQEGVGYFQQTAKGGKRCSAASAYYHPIKSRQNLKLFSSVKATRIIFDAKRAVGVSILGKKVKQVVSARKEVIVSCGAVASPQLLMLSGIGPGKELKKNGIMVYENLPGVGKNLQDHLQARPVFKCNAPTLNTEIKNPLKLLGMGLNYLIRKRGPITLAASLGVGFLRTDKGQENPDIQFHIQPFSMDKPSITSLHKFDGFTASVLQLRPESSGEIALRSPLVDDKPLIRPNYLSTEKDCATIIKAIKIARMIACVQPLKNLICEEFQPGKNVQIDDDDATLDWVKNTAVTIYHPTGTCKMGNDKTAVVDERLRVRGMRNLRVVDASIMPRITSGNTNAPTLMIAEKASDMILEDANK